MPLQSDPVIRVFSPLYLLRARQDCWRCQASQEVIAILTCHLHELDPEHGEYVYEDEPILLQSIESMPGPILQHLLSVHPQFEKRSSKTAGTAYYMNTCSCGAHFGDFFLFSEPGGAFFPVSEDDATAITIETFPFTGCFEFVCNYGIGPGAVLFQHARHTSRA